MPGPPASGQCWIAPLPCCPVHGRLHYRSQARPCGPPELGIRVITWSGWACLGWDGEGCGYAVSSGDLPWEPAGMVTLVSRTGTW
jgi:hypothetical protein